MRKPERLKSYSLEPETAPLSCWKRVWYLLRTSWSELVLLNLLTVLCSILVLTIPAALLAQHRIIICLCGDDGFPLGKTYFQEFFRSIWVGFLLDLLLLPLAAMLMVLGGFSSLFSQSTSGLVLLLLIVFATIWSWFVYSYVFVMKAAVELRWMHVLTNALLLSVLEFRWNVRLLLPLLLLAAGVFLLPYSCVLFILCLPSICAALTSCMVYPVLKKRLNCDDK